MSLDDLIPEGRDGGSFGQATAYIATFTNAPASVDELAEVTVSGLDDQLTYTKVRWMPREGVLPSVGDPALLLFDDDNDPWIVAWWPYA